MIGLPLWFRAGVALLFGALFLSFLLVRERSAARAEGGAATPRTESAAAFASDADGDYRVNGVPVRARHLWFAGSGESVLRRLDADATHAGYRTRRAAIAERPAMLALHPETGVLLTANVAEESGGQTLVRLSEQRLRRADDPRALVPRDVAVLPESSDLVVVTPVDAAASSTTSYAVARPSTWTSRAIAARMLALGWKPVAQDTAAADGARWLRKGDREASVVVETAETGRSLVMISVQASTGGTAR